MPAEPTKPSLEAYGRAFRQMQIRPEADARIRARLQAPLRWNQRRFLLSPRYWALAAVVVVVTIGLAIPRVKLAPPPVSCEVESKAGLNSYRGTCQLALEGMTVSMTSEVTTLVEEMQRVELVEGSASFVVEKVAVGGEPVVIRVPGGRIEVLGTHFDVQLMSSQGALTLHEGRIRFTSDGQSAVVMHPGERVVWRWAEGDRPPIVPPLGSTLAHQTESEPMLAPRPEPPSTTAKTAAPTPSRATRQPSERTPPPATGEPPRASRRLPQPETAIARIMELKLQGKFSQALLALDKAASGVLAPHAREVLSFERGVLLERIDGARACAQFELHQSRYHAGQYARAADQRLKRCASSHDSLTHDADNSPPLLDDKTQ